MGDMVGHAPLQLELSREKKNLEVHLRFLDDSLFILTSASSRLIKFLGLRSDSSFVRLTHLL